MNSDRAKVFVYQLTLMNMYRHLCVLMSMCACFYVNLWAQQPDGVETWVPSEQEEEGRRGAWQR